MRGEPGRAQDALLQEIWIVDDDRGVRFVLAEALRDADLAVREFGEVASVRAALREARPALLLTDVRMPGAACREIRVIARFSAQLRPE